MRKKAIAFAAVIVGVVTMVTVVSAFALNTGANAQEALPEETAPIVAAAPVAQSLPVEQIAYSDPNGEPAGNFDVFSLMFDENGEPVSEDVLEANLNKAIKEGYLDAADKDFLLDMFDLCVAGGMGADAGFPCGPGMGGCPFSQ